ncbi:MAG: DUF2130 domain-containing protein [Prevotellaceae bacterium]|nr:DUF2130 domain-containing protein [Prevotellaceae bacterium]
MKELKCPKCGSVFQVDEADYASILSQVKTAEFDKEIASRLEELHKRQAAEQALQQEKARQAYQSQLSQKQLELSAQAAEIARLKQERQSDLSKLEAEKEMEIARLKSQLENIEAKKAVELTAAIAQKDQTIERLNAAIRQEDDKRQMALMEAQGKAREAMQAKEMEITRLQQDAALRQREAQIQQGALIKQYEEQLKAKQEQVDYYKDFKTKMSTKMVGETLEQHCSIQFERYIRPMMPHAYFDKDNDAIEGTKGDFIFRDSEDGMEYISIMFEMKNEMDTTATKHKNEDFLKKLDEDRTKKKCEFAVLVSLLEADNDLYNDGIVDKSHLYPKMYVIRPQFFVSFINLLVQASKKSLDYKRELELARNKEVDVTGFEQKMEDFKAKFSRHYEQAGKKFNDAIKQIDDTISKLQKIKDNLLSSENNLRLAQQDTEELTIRRLTYKNPTMKAKFDEARKAGAAVEVKEGEE